MNSDKEMADLFYNLYMGCLRYKNKKDKYKNINCNEYFIQYQFFSEASKQQS